VIHGLDIPERVGKQKKFLMGYSKGDLEMPIDYPSEQ
jgi:hypothetical protein